MIHMTVGELERYLAEYLNVAEFQDFTFNGLNIGVRNWEIRGVITATDYDKNLVDRAEENGANVIIVHHGLWWGKPYPIVDKTYDELAYLMHKKIALLGYHLPLDAHPEIGNNAYILKTLGISPEAYNPLDVGFAVDVDMSVDDITSRLETTLGRPREVWVFGNGNVRRLGVISGSGGSFVNTLVSDGVDTFITGEITYPAWREFKKYGINVILYGHYRSETGGPKLLAEHIGAKFDIPAQFVDIYERAM